MKKVIYTILLSVALPMLVVAQQNGNVTSAE